MSWKASAWAKTVKTGSPAAKAILLCVADYADEDNSCYPGQERLADESEQSVRSVRRHLDHLETIGAITRERRFDAKGHRTSDRFILHIERDLSKPKAAKNAEIAGKNPNGQSGRLESGSVPNGQIDLRSDETVLPANGDHPYRPPVSGEPLEEPLDKNHQIHGGDDEQPTLVVADGGSSTRAIGTRRESETREDVERVCQHLAEAIVANGGRRPTITKKWRDEARLLMDRDGISEERVHKAIDWCQGHPFWRANVLSMPTLREKYDQLRLQALREQEGGRTPSNIHRAPSVQEQEIASAFGG